MTQPTDVAKSILWGGLGAGALDITAAFIDSGLRGVGPILVLQSVAGGMLGRDSFQGGLRTALLGLVLHFFIATMWAAAYCVASLKLPWLTRQAVRYGLLYGVVVYLVMYMTVLPLSALHFKFFDQSVTAMLTGVLIHAFCVGLPIALVIRWRAK
jgi:hypothetical protein